MMPPRSISEAVLLEDGLGDLPHGGAAPKSPESFASSRVDGGAADDEPFVVGQCRCEETDNVVIDQAVDHGKTRAAATT
jgi:hypothetical protein